ncbi:hypothetical protein MMC26_002876 [Xylographa opegraphella]|nr:hypothetical protein [Xylographa opegraphella]
MPYTPPAQQSPVASRPETPALSRSQSYINQQQLASPALTTSPRPGLPRSASSTSYLHRHRRSPSVTKPTAFSAPPATPDATPINAEYRTPKQENRTDNAGNPRQFSPLLSGLGIPTGAAMSPPDSAQNSSDEETNVKTGRTRELENLAELQAAIRIIEQHRESSPTRRDEETKKARMTLGLIMPSSKPVVPEQETSTRPPLSKEARRISHSRSATESSAYLDTTSPAIDSPARSASDSDGEDCEEWRSKPPMLRKKSGELVRPAIRPSSSRRRPSSMPGTPTYSKAVHFDSNLEHVRHFLQVDRPLAVSAGSSPTENYESEVEFPFRTTQPSLSPPFEWEIRLSNWPRDTPERSTMPVRVEKVFLSSDNKHLIGSVVVANLSFHKLVVARFTLDYWKTTSEVVAEYSNDVRRKQADDGHDRFNFSIKLEDQANLESKTMFFCVRYNVNGQEFWDSNGNMNYQVDFAKKALPQNGKQGMAGNAARPLNALPRSKPSASPSAGRPRPKSTSFEEFNDGLESRYDFGSFPQPAAKALGETPIRFKKPANLLPDAPGRRTNTPAQAFGNRYDFGASLSAAIQAASTALGDRSGLQSKEESPLPSARSTKQTAFVQRPFLNSSVADGSSMVGRSNEGAVSSNGSKAAVPASGATGSDSLKPAALTSEKPSLQSHSYHELLDKYCFFGSAKVSPQLPKPVNGQADGPADDHPLTVEPVEEQPRSNSPSPLPSPPAEKAQSPPAVTSSHRSRSPSSNGSTYGSRAASPVSFAYPYRQPMQNSFFSDTCQSTAIRG